MSESLIINLSVAILFLPLLGFSVVVLLGKRFPKLYLFEVGIISVAFILSLVVMYAKLAYFSNDIIAQFTWITMGSAPFDGTFNIDLGIKIDNITVMMLFVVNLISLLVHLFSIEYMHGDKRYTRYFSYLGIFTFSMLGIVLTHNLLMMYIFWELVGLSSYLLIGFWFEKKSAADASKKAFIVNRIGDIGMFLGILILFANYKTFTFDAIYAQMSSGVLPFESNAWLTAAGILIFLGAVGKSAQFPLHVWLPDAMEGPTPVSALIHAATMVAAGVYLVTRIFVMLTADAMLVIAVVGAFTSLVAATIALTQNDIKKVLAYSTVSQLGYMFLAAGMGAFSASIFHVMTHAFFKALLFLGAGSVIHGMHEEQNIQKYGGLKKYMPRTYLTFFIATLAIAGVPGLSGFFSKDEILWNAYANGGFIFWLIGIITAMMTAFYMFRLLSLTFYGKERFDHHHVHPHESPAVMTVPLMILAFLSIVGGYVGLPKVFVGQHGNLFETWLHPIYEPALNKLALFGAHSHFEEILLMSVSVALVLSAIYFALNIYTKKPQIAESVSIKFKGLYNMLLNKYFVDEAYESVVVKPIQKGSEKILWKIADVTLIDGAVNGLAKLVDKLSGSLRKIQTGVTQSYAVVMMTGIAIVLLWLILSL